MARDDFFSKEVCDRCSKPFNGRRIMSMFNTDCICMKCKEEEKSREDYKDAVLADISEIKRGNYNFSGCWFIIKKEGCIS